MTIVEKMARAIHLNARSPSRRAWEAEDPDVREWLMGHARAALSVLMEPSEGMVRKVAPVLLDHEEFGLDPTLLEVNAGWGQRIIDHGLSTEHDGDCTKAPYTCNRCLAEEAVERAKIVIKAAIQAALDETPGQVPPPSSEQGEGG